MPSSLPVLRARPSENTFKLPIVSFNAPEFSDSTISTLRSASRAACVVLCPAPVSATSRPLAARRDLRAALERITGTPVRPWKSRPTLVSARTGVSSDGDGRMTPRGFRGEAELGDLADTDAIEQHGGADQQARNRASNWTR